MGETVPFLVRVQLCKKVILRQCVWGPGTKVPMFPLKTQIDLGVSNEGLARAKSHRKFSQVMKLHGDVWAKQS